MDTVTVTSCLRELWRQEWNWEWCSIVCNGFEHYGRLRRTAVTHQTSSIDHWFTLSLDVEWHDAPEIRLIRIRLSVEDSIAMSTRHRYYIRGVGKDRVLWFWGRTISLMTLLHCVTFQAIAGTDSHPDVTKPTWELVALLSVKLYRKLNVKNHRHLSISTSASQQALNSLCKICRLLSDCETTSGVNSSETRLQKDRKNNRLRRSIATQLMSHHNIKDWAHSAA